MLLEVGVKVFLTNDKGQVLLIKRSSPLPDGSGIKWDVPGGRIKPEESLFEALQREVSEETGLEITDSPKLINAQDIFIDQDKHIVRLTYSAKCSGEALISQEHKEYAWVSRKDLATNDIDKYLAETIDYYSIS